MIRTNIKDTKYTEYFMGNGKVLMQNSRICSYLLLKCKRIIYILSVLILIKTILKTETKFHLEKDNK